MIDIFKEVNLDTTVPEWFKFAKVGDSVQGTYVNKMDGVDGYGNKQIIYQLKVGAKLFNTGFRESKKDIHQDMSTAKYGEIVGIKYVEDRRIKNKMGQMVDIKIYRAWHDPKIVDPGYKKSDSTVFVDTSKKSPEAVDPKDDFGEFSNFGVKEESPVPTVEAKLTPAQKRDVIQKLAKDKGLSEEGVMEATDLAMVAKNYDKIIEVLKKL